MHAEQGMDGEAIVEAFGSMPGPDCLRDVLPKLGVRLKVYNAIRQQLGTEVGADHVGYPTPLRKRKGAW